MLLAVKPIILVIPVELLHISDGRKAIEPPVKRRMNILDHILSDDEKEEEDLSVSEKVKSYL